MSPFTAGKDTLIRRFLRKQFSKMNSYAEYAGNLHRRSLGQYFTHPKVANFMVQWVLGSGHTVLFDPAFGLGAFRDPVRKESAIGFSASAFLVKSISELAPAGRLAYIMPLEFLNAGYGTIVKQQLIESRHLSAVLHLDCEKDVFPDVTTSIGIVLFDKPVLLFSPKQKQSCGAAEYIKYGETAGFNVRFLTKSRKPWYKTESRHPAPLLLGVFSRGGYKVILNRTKALHLTCFHGFQPNLFGEQHLEHIFLYLCSNIGRELISLSMRKYGDSLDKFEPNDLNDALAPSADFLAAMPKDKVSAAVQEIAQTGRAPSWVEGFFAQLKVGQVTESVFAHKEEKRPFHPKPKVGASGA